MMESILIKGALIINENKQYLSDLRILGEHIESIAPSLDMKPSDKVIDANGLILIPGMIDDQVHFREPGLTHKATIFSESRAAIAGGITSFMEMPNTKPPATTQVLLEEKYQIAAKHALANYSFFMGASNDNLEEVLKTDPKRVCGVKVFMGSSTGNMLVDDPKTLEKLFASYPGLIAVHCEDETTIRENEQKAKARFGEDVPVNQHPLIRSEEACYLSSSKAVRLAKKHGTRLHILHISTEKELALFEPGDLEHKKITAEACIHHLWFNDSHYATKGTRIKWNPAVKKESDRKAILEAVRTNRIDVIATDHAPHTVQEKNQSYFKAPSGGPLVQHALLALLDLVAQGELSLEQVVEKTSHAPARLFQIKNRGFIREGYQADLVLIDPNRSWEVKSNNIRYKCGWSPFDGHTFKSRIIHTFVNGYHAYEKGLLHEEKPGQRLEFNRNATV
jgi:dihydroorotase